MEESLSGASNNSLKLTRGCKAGRIAAWVYRLSSCEANCAQLNSVLHPHKPHRVKEESVDICMNEDGAGLYVDRNCRSLQPLSVTAGIEGETEGRGGADGRSHCRIEGRESTTLADRVATGED